MIKNFLKYLIPIACIAIIASAMVACSSQSSTDETAATDDSTATEEAVVADGDSADAMSIKIGASSQTVPLIESGIPALEAKGYTVEVVPFDDYNTPNRALDEGEITCNFYQHAPFLDEYNSNNGTDLVMLEPALWNFFTGLYSTKHASIDDLPDGATIAVANDASNISLEFAYLQEWGLITLADEPSDSSGLYTELDIVDNPKNLSFMYTDDTQRYASRDEYDAYIGASDKLFIEGYDPTADMIAQKVEEQTALGIVVRSEDANSQLATDLIEAYLSDEAVQQVEAEMKGGFVLSEAAQSAR